MPVMSAPQLTAARPVARKIVIDLTIMTVIGVVLALIGPFGSFDVPLAYRLVSWVLFAWIGYAIYSPMGLLVDRLERALALPRPGLWFFAVLIATVPMTIIVWAFGYLPGPVPLPSLQQALMHYFYVFLVGGVVTAFFYAIESRRPAATSAPSVQSPAAKASEEPAPSIRFLDRLPPELGTGLLALEMEDHYVRAHTVLGSDLVLMRLRDAMAELDGVEGMQVHRSWWVARLAVRDVKRDGRNVRLVLENGIEAPVSRTNVQPLKDAGWI